MTRRRLSDITRQNLIQQRRDSTARLARLERAITRESEKLAAIDEVLAADIHRGQAR